MVVNWIGQYRKNAEIAEFIRELFGKDIAPESLEYYRYHENWQPTIQKAREKYASEMYQVEMSNVRRRVEKLSDVVERNFEKGKDNLVISGLHEIHDQLKKEGPTVQNNYQLNMYKEMSEEDFDKRELELIQKRKKLKEELDGGKTS